MRYVYEELDFNSHVPLRILCLALSPFLHPVVSIYINVIQSNSLLSLQLFCHLYWYYITAERWQWTVIANHCCSAVIAAAIVHREKMTSQFPVNYPNWLDGSKMDRLTYFECVHLYMCSCVHTCVCMCIHKCLYIWERLTITNLIGNRQLFHTILNHLFQPPWSLLIFICKSHTHFILEIYFKSYLIFNLFFIS